MVEAPAEGGHGDSATPRSASDEADGARAGRGAAPRWRFTDAVQAARHIGGSRG